MAGFSDGTLSSDGGVLLLRQIDADLGLTAAGRLQSRPALTCPLKLERENTELKKIVANQAFEIRILKDVNSEKWQSPQLAAPPWIIFRTAIR